MFNFGYSALPLKLFSRIQTPKVIYWECHLHALIVVKSLEEMEDAILRLN